MSTASLCITIVICIFPAVVKKISLLLFVNILKTSCMPKKATGLFGSGCIVYATLSYLSDRLNCTLASDSHNAHHKSQDASCFIFPCTVSSHISLY
jgi:hypothetical protein